MPTSFSLQYAILYQALRAVRKGGSGVGWCSCKRYSKHDICGANASGFPSQTLLVRMSETSFRRCQSRSGDHHRSLFVGRSD